MTDEIHDWLLHLSERERDAAHIAYRRYLTRGHMGAPMTEWLHDLQLLEAHLPELSPSWLKKAPRC
jgi:hypothetical protein